MITDWLEIAKRICAIDENGSESGGDNYAELAFDEILGEEWIHSTVDYILSFKPGSETALNCLRLIHSKRAAEYAYDRYKASQGERAEQAVYIIKYIAHPISFDKIEEFLTDENVMHIGLGVLDQLLWTEQILYDDNVQSLFNLAIDASNGQLQEQVKFIESYLKQRQKNSS